MNFRIMQLTLHVLNMVAFVCTIESNIEDEKKTFIILIQLDH